MSSRPLAHQSGIEAMTSSPVTSATLGRSPCRAAAASNASRQACGFSPPALATTRMPRWRISARCAAMAASTKSVAYPTGQVFAACPRHDRHGGLGQVVVDQVLQPWHGQQLWRGHRRVASEAAGAADTDALVLHADALMPRNCT